MFSRTICNVIIRTVYENTRTFHKLRIVSTSNLYGHSLCMKNEHLSEKPNPTIFKRSKKKAVEHTKEEEEDEEDSQLDVDDYLIGKNTKTITTTIPSLRLDAVVKAGFGIARSKVDKEFYNSNIRVNGERRLKKNVLVAIDDEIDLITGRSPKSSDFLVVHRCVLLSAKVVPEDEGIRVKILRNKSLVIEDYDDAWNGVKD